MCRLIGDEVPDLKPFIPTAVLDNCDLTRLLCVAFIVLFCLFIYFIMVTLLKDDNNHGVTRQCVHCCKGDAASRWERAILGCQNSVTHEPID